MGRWRWTLARSWAVAGFAGLTGLALVVASGDAAARPSIWDRARDPNALKSERLLEEAERRLQDLSGEEDDPLGLRRSAQIAAAIAALQDEQASSLPDARLHLALGDLWLPVVTAIGERGGSYEKAIKELEWVVAHAPDGPVAADAWIKLSTAYAKRKLRERERHAYDRILDLEPRAEIRGTTYYNRGEVALENGELEAAIADYRRAIPLVGHFIEQSLVYWSLGLALERSGDLPAALDAVATAQAIYPPTRYPTALDEPSAFFVPPYEVFYMKGLGELACARDAPTKDLVRESYDNAVVFFEAYIAGAKREHHRGLESAKLELATIQRKLTQITKAPQKGDDRSRTSTPVPARPPRQGADWPIRYGCPRPPRPVPSPLHLLLPTP